MESRHPQSYLPRLGALARLAGADAALSLNAVSCALFLCDDKKLRIGDTTTRVRSKRGDTDRRA